MISKAAFTKIVKFIALGSGVFVLGWDSINHTGNVILIESKRDNPRIISSLFFKVIFIFSIYICNKGIGTKNNYIVNVHYNIKRYLLWFYR